MSTTSPASTQINPDKPVKIPSEDQFGYLSHAERIARAIHKTPPSQGNVLAIHGEWGSGKSSFLNLVKHSLGQYDESIRPIFVDFNPWWFKDHEDLAAQFLAQFAAKLRFEKGSIRAVGDLLADYHSAIASAVTWTIPIPGLSKAISFVLQLFKRKPKSVPELKQKISAILEKSSNRILFVVDDIDRLSPNEIRELFKVIKALGDFANVTYLLAFDRGVVTSALKSSLGVDGDAYIEKIVQVSFSLPAIDRKYLRKMLFDGLGSILEANPGIAFSENHWTRVYFLGLDNLINNPRDVVRVLSAVRIQYPSVAGEVNPVDFIAMEVMRIKCAETYDVIRSNRDKFTFVMSDRSPESGEREQLRVFHESWLGKLPSASRPMISDLVQSLFPQLARILDTKRSFVGSSSDWYASRRVCSDKVIDFYFQFGVPPDALSRAELLQFVQVCELSEREGREYLMRASAAKRLDGTSKAVDILDDIRALESELSEHAAFSIISVLFDVGDELLTNRDEEDGGMLGIPNRWRLTWTIDHLLSRMPKQQWPIVLGQGVSNGRAIGLGAYVVDSIDEEHKKNEGTQNSPLAHIDESDLVAMRTRIVERLSTVEPLSLLQVPDFSALVMRWQTWADSESVRAALQKLICDDALVPVVLEKYLRVGRQWGSDDMVAAKTYKFDMEELARVFDIASLARRVVNMRLPSDLSVDQAKAIDEFKERAASLLA